MRIPVNIKAIFTRNGFYSYSLIEEGMRRILVE